MLSDRYRHFSRWDFKYVIHLITRNFSGPCVSTNNSWWSQTWNNVNAAVNKSHVYSFPTCILKYACDNIQDILANIFNRLLESGKYASKFKMVKVIPIFKADDDSDPNNYRPISLLSRFKGIFKKLTYTRMNSFIDKEGVLCSSRAIWV